MTRTIIGAVAFVAMFAAIAPASAADVSLVPHETVAYDDLDLSHTAGAQVLLARIESAAERVCGGKPDPFNLNAREIYARCYDKAMDGAVAQVNQPQLAKLYSSPARNTGLAMNQGSQDVAENIGAGDDASQHRSLISRLADLF